MNLDNAVELKQRLLEEMYRDAPGGNVGLRAQGLPVREAHAEQLGVGYTRVGKSDYQLALRLRRRRGRAYEAAMRVKKRAKEEVNIAFIESLSVPSVGDLVQAAQKAASHPFSARKRPLHLGLSIGHRNGGPGTLGAFVETSDGEDAILSACHVLAPVGNSKKDDPIYQPGKESSQLTHGDSVAKLINFTAFSNTGSNYLDGAYAVLEGQDIGKANVVPEGCELAAHKPIRGVVGYDALEPHQTVAKIGKGSGCTIAAVTSFGVDDLVIDIPNAGNTRFDDLLEITWDPDKPFAQAGDSGSLVFTTDSLDAVGLHFAGGLLSMNGTRKGFSYSCNLRYLLDIFNLKFIPGEN